MPGLIDQLRARFPEFKDYTDEDIVTAAAPAFGGSVDEAARRLGIERSDPGFFTTIRRTAGQMIQGAGEIGHDLGLENNALQRLGSDIIFRNPSGINQLSDVVESPGLALREAAGMAVGFFGPQLGLRAGGLGLQALGAARSGTALGGATQAAGRAAASPWGGGMAVTGLPSLGAIGEAQREAGEENLLMKYGGAAAVGAIEQIGGPQRFLRGAPSAGVVGGIPREALAEMGRTPLRTFGMGVARMGGQEALEEVVQNPIEQFASYQDPLAPQQLEETALGAIMGGLGGIIPFGVASGARRAMQQRTARDFVDRNLTNVDQATQQRLDAAEIQRGFMAQQMGDQAADDWYRSVTDQILADRQAAIAQALQAGVPFDLLSGDVPTLRQQTQDQMVQAAKAAQAQPQGAFQPLPTDQPMMGLPHAAPAMPIGAGTEPPINRAASIYANLAGMDLSPESQEAVDFDWAKGVLQQTLGPEGFTKFVTQVVPQAALQQKSENPAARPKAPKLAKPAQPVQQTPQQPVSYGARFKALGGRVTNVVKALDAAKTQEEAVDIVRQWIEKPTIAQSTHNALAELHKELTGETYEQYLRRTEEAERAANVQAPGPVTVIRPTAAEGEAMAAQMGVQQNSAQDVIAPAVTNAKSPTQSGTAPTQFGQPRAQDFVARGQTTQLPSEPEELMSFLMNEIGRRDKRKQVILEASLGRLDGNAHSDAEIAQELGLGKSTVQSLRKEAEAIFHQLVRKYDIRPEQLKPRDEPALEEEVIDDRSSLVEQPAGVSVEETTATSEEHGVAALAPSQQEDEGNTDTGYRIIDRASDINSDKSGSPEDTQAKRVAGVFEGGDVEEEAATVWDAFAHRRTEQGERVKSWDALAKTERGRQTQREWVEFYQKSKESPKPDIAQLARLSKTIKGQYATAGMRSSQGQYTQLDWPEFFRLLEQAEPIDLSPGNVVGENIKAVWDKFAEDGLGSVITSRIVRMRLATESLGRRHIIVGRIPGETGYSLLFNPDFVLRAGQLAFHRAIDHEFWHIVDDAATGGAFSNNMLWSRAGAVARTVRGYNGPYTQSANFEQWVGWLFGYPLDPFFSSLDETTFRNELFAQAMSAYHADARLSEELRTVFPLIYSIAEAAHAEIRSRLAINTGAVQQRPPGQTDNQGPSASTGRQPDSRGARSGVPGSRSPRGTPLASEGQAKAFLDDARYFYHAVRNDADIDSIMRVGLAPGSNVSHTNGQAFDGEGDTVLVFERKDYRLRPKGYQDDEVVVGGTGKPVAILKDVQPFVKQAVTNQDILDRSEALGREYDQLEKRVQILSNTLNIPVEELRTIGLRLQMARGELRRGRNRGSQFYLGMKREAEQKLGEFADSMLDILKKEDYLFRRMDEIPLEAQPSVSRVDVLTPYRKYGIPVHSFRTEFTNEGDIQRVVLASAGAIDEYASLGLNSLPKGLKEPALRVKDTLTNWGKKGLQYIVFAHDLADLAVKEGLTKSKNFFDLINAKGATLIHLEAEVDRILTEAANVSDRQAVNNFLRRSTREQKWGYAPTWRPDVTVDPSLAADYNKLSDNGKKVVDAVFKYGDDTYSQLVTLVNKEINDEFDAQLSAATTEEQKKEIEEERRRHMRTAGRVMPKLQGPYAPLRRFGDYVVVAKSKAYRDAESLNDHKAMEEMQDDPRHYRVEFHEHFAEAKSRARELEKSFPSGYVDAFERQKSYSKLQELPWSAIKRVKDAVEGLPDKADHKAALNRILTDLYLVALSESSARKAELHRRYVPGEDPDMLRAFAYNGRATAHFVASLQHNSEINDILNQMKSEAREGSVGTRENRSRILNEILARYVQGLDRRPTPLADKAMRFTSLWFLVSSPSYYLQNATQPFMLTLPMLNARFGAGASWAALLKAYKDIAPVVKAFGHTLNIDALPISPDEKNMLAQLRDIGLIDITIAQDLGRWTEGETVLDKGVFGKAMRKLWAAPRQLEMINRITSALAAWRLSEGNYDYTSRILKQTHGNYAASNAPRVFNANGVAKLILQFRKFQLIQASLLGRLLHDAFRGSSEERMVARYAVAWLLSHHMVLAGALGLPAANLIGYMLAAIGGDDDEPKDAERFLREAIGDKDVADLLLKGLPAFLGVDVSRRVGMGETFSVLPFTDIKLLDRKGLGETLMGAGGPFIGGLLPRWADGAGLVARGDYYKGLELMMPRALQDSMKAFRFAQEGVTHRNMDVVMQPEELSLFTLMSQVLGLPSKTLTDRQRVEGELIEMQEYYKERLTTMRHKYAKAYRENDADTMADMREEWAAVAQAMRRNGLKPQPLSNLLKAPLDQRNRERETVAGVQVRRNNRTFVLEQSEL